MSFLGSSLMLIFLLALKLSICLLNISPKHIVLKIAFWRLMVFCHPLLNIATFRFLDHFSIFFPAYWKGSFVTPALKSGDHSQVNNYQLISILRCIRKVFECAIIWLLACRIVLSNNNLDFFLTVPLSTFTDFLLESLEEGYPVHAVYTDFIKAFDWKRSNW